MSQIKNRNNLHVFINGISHQITNEDAFLPLAQYLRGKAQLPGTKVVCSEGDCGACTVLVAKLENDEWSSFQTINSCIAPMYLFDLCSIVTVEGLGRHDELNEVQEKMRDLHGAQCGYCTPGMVCAISCLAEESVALNKEFTEKSARNNLTGNLCRCTGYEPILKAATQLNLSKWKSLAATYLTDDNKKYFSSLPTQPVLIEAETKYFIAPTELKEALRQKEIRPTLRIIAGGTDLGVIHNKGRSTLDECMGLNKIPEMSQLKNTPEGLWVGACVSLTSLERFVADQLPELSRLLRVFASPQIKNQGTLIGNILNGSPIGDSIPAALALDAKLHLASSQGTRIVPLDQFYKGYKLFDIRPDEIALGLMIPKLTPDWNTRFYKVSLRKDLDISAVTFATAFVVKDNMIQQVRLAMGGVGPTVIRLPELEKEMQGKAFTEELFKEMGHKVRSLIKPISDLRASDEYRLLVAQNLFLKCYLELQQEITTCQ